MDNQVVTHLTVKLYANLANFHLCLCHHVLIRLQVHSERLPHFSHTIIQDLHLHIVLLVTLFEHNFCQE